MSEMLVLWLWEMGFEKRQEAGLCSYLQQGALFKTNFRPLPVINGNPTLVSLMRVSQNRGVPALVIFLDPFLLESTCLRMSGPIFHIWWLIKRSFPRNDHQQTTKKDDLHHMSPVTHGHFGDPPPHDSAVLWGVFGP